MADKMIEDELIEAQYRDFVSDEPLFAIRINECEADLTSLCTKRYRRLWNEILAQRAAIAEARAVFGKFDLAKLHSEDAYLHAVTRHVIDRLDAALAPAKEPT